MKTESGDKRSHGIKDAKDANVDRTDAKDSIRDGSDTKDSRSKSATDNIDPALYNGSPDTKGKLTNQVSPAQFTGWTPLISKTIPQEQFNFQSTTPSSSKFINNILLNSNSHNSILPVNDIDYSNGFNLTPFLNHNLNLLNSNIYGTGSGSGSGSNQHNQNFASLTPFHDKTLHLSDFFIESPIRTTPIKDLGTITPSKFNLGSIKKSTPLFQDPKSAKKRSIHELDTPNKQPHKLSITTKANDATDEEDETEDEENKVPRRQLLDRSRGVLSNLQTPSKVVIMGDISNKPHSKDAKTPSRLTNSKFVTPAKPTQTSSPSTVILSSGSKSPIKERKFVPASPTPASNKFTVKRDDSIDNVVVEPPVMEPAMGTFNDKTLKSNNNKKNAKSRTIDPLNKGTSSKPRFGNNVQVNSMRFQPNNKAQMQAGMNKFQIVLSDGQTMKRGRKCKKQQPQQRKNNKKEVVVETQAHADTSKRQMSPRPLNASGGVAVATRDVQYNSTMNNSSINHNSMNTSGMNVTQNTDHTSFDFGVLSSTPNGKYLLDKMFEKPSPQSQQLISQVLMGQHFNGMPPPKTNGPGPQTQIQTQQNHVQNSQVMMMMMSTPNHQQMYSPNEEEGENEGNISLSAFSYTFDQKGTAPAVSLMNQDHE